MLLLCTGSCTVTEERHRRRAAGADRSLREHPEFLVWMLDPMQRSTYVCGCMIAPMSSMMHRARSGIGDVRGTGCPVGVQPARPHIAAGSASPSWAWLWALVPWYHDRFQPRRPTGNRLSSGTTEGTRVQDVGSKRVSVGSVSPWHLVNPCASGRSSLRECVGSAAAGNRGSPEKSPR